MVKLNTENKAYQMSYELIFFSAAINTQHQYNKLKNVSRNKSITSHKIQKHIK